MKLNWFIHLDGHDNSGKSSILREFNKQTNYAHTIIDRSFLSTIVYSIKYNRNVDRFVYLNQLMSIASTIPTCVVLCYTNFDVFLDRYKLDDKKDMKYAINDARLLDEFKTDYELFESCANLIADKCNVIKLDTSNLTPSGSALKIIESLETIERTVQ